MQRMWWAISQLGVRRSSHLPEPLPMLLDVTDLPDGWTVLDQRRWRTGLDPSLWSQRAKELGGVTAWRSFQSAAKESWLWTEAIPLTSETDVSDALPEIWSRTLKNLRAKVRLVGEIEGPKLSGLSTAHRTLEQATDGPFGSGVVRLVAWSHRTVLNALCATAKGDAWDWSELEALASKQNRRIHLVLAKPSESTP